MLNLEVQTETAGLETSNKNRVFEQKELPNLLISVST